jgi:hypothetical protein
MTVTVEVFIQDRSRRAYAAWCAQANKIAGKIMSSLFMPPNGPQLNGADPHATKYSAREVATGGSASGAAWS